MDRSTDNDVLDACAKTLEFLCTEGTAIYTRCDVARSTLIDTLVNKYKEAMDDWRSLIEGVSNLYHTIPLNNPQTHMRLSHSHCILFVSAL